MRLPDMKNYSSNGLYETKKINITEKCDFQIILFNDKDKVKFIKKLEHIVRSSMEYRELIKYFKDVIDMNQCSFFTGISSKDSRHRVSIEIHHEPFTLYDLCQIVLEKCMNSIEGINVMRIAEEVMKLHYQNKVGLIPLSTTVHEIVHNGELFIPLQCVYGDYVALVEEYKPYISNQLSDILYMKLQMSKEIVNTSILEKKFVYLDIDGMKFPSMIQ